VLRDTPMVLNHEKREVVERAITDHCRIRNWCVHALNIRSTMSMWS